MVLPMKNEENIYEKAEEYFEAEEYEKAFVIYKELAEEGSIDSQVFLAWMYQNGLGVNKNKEEAFVWFNKAATSGSASAQFYLAKYHANQNELDKAIDYYQQAAEKNYSPALFRLGLLYETGRGTEKDTAKAVYYYRKASLEGHVFAKKQLGLLLLKGYGSFFDRCYGAFLLVTCVFLVIYIAFKDHKSDMLRE